MNLTGFTNYFDIEDLNPSQYRGASSLGLIKNFGDVLKLNSEENYLKAYNECSPLKSIIARRAKAFNTGIIEIYNTNTNNPSTTPKAKELRRLLKKPNPLQTGKQFMAQHNTYLDVFGYCPVFIIRPFGFTDQISAIWNIPPWLFDIEYTGSWLEQSTVEGIYKSYTLRWISGGKPLAKENLKLIFDDGFGTDDDINLTIPDSRLKSNEYPVSNIIAAYKARNTLITKRGATGILSNGNKDTVGHIPLKDGEKENLQKEFQRYGIVGQEWQVIISDANLSWQQMGFPTKELMLFEEIEDDIMRLCDAYGVPYRLMASEKSASYNDVREFGKSMYQDTIIPESDSRLEQLTNGLSTTEDSLRISRDFSGIYLLQEDKEQAARARKTNDEALEREFKNNVITLNDWRNALGLDNIEGGDNNYTDLVKQGWSFANSGSSSAGAVTQTDTTANN